MGIADYKDRKYEIVKHDATWPEKFAAEAEVVKDVFSDMALAIEHIGSTAVPGLAGKPTIDILVLVNNVVVADELTEKMVKVGYVALGEYVMPSTRLFAKDKDGHRIVNVHVFEKDHPHIKEMLGLRDYLRVHPEVVAEYSQLKFDLADSYPDDYGSYRKYKDAFVDDLMQKLK
ncbi:TPA: hypothetical protein DEP96_04055 [Candidatus Uhrbacteria bacterium]|nr:hypothetical protein [Candidatus Uhrbacteria bacterium]